MAKYLSNSFIFIWANVWNFHRPPIGKYEITYVIQKNYSDLWNMIEERHISNYMIIWLLDIRIHINKFSCAKYFPNRMMNELDKKYVQFNHIDQWKLFLTALWSIKNVCIVILIYWVMKIDPFSCWWDAQAKKIQIDCFIGLAEAFS